MISGGLIQHVVGDQVGLGGERLGCGGHDPWRPIVQFVAQVDPVRDGGGHRCGILPIAGGDPDGQFGRRPACCLHDVGEHSQCPPLVVEVAG